jgi:hypothetical protein
MLQNLANLMRLSRIEMHEYFNRMGIVRWDTRVLWCRSQLPTSLSARVTAVLCVILEPVAEDRSTRWPRALSEEGSAGLGPSRGGWPALLGALKEVTVCSIHTWSSLP